MQKLGQYVAALALLCVSFPVAAYVHDRSSDLTEHTAAWLEHSSADIQTWRDSLANFDHATMACPDKADVGVFYITSQRPEMVAYYKNSLGCYMTLATTTTAYMLVDRGETFSQVTMGGKPMFVRTVDIAAR